MTDKPHLDYDKLEHHPFTERIVQSICNRIGTKEDTFFRNHVNYYLTVVASMMRAMIHEDGKPPRPINAYMINLAPSGFGKGHSTAILEDEVIEQFRDNFVNETMTLLAEDNIPALALERANRRNTDPDEEAEKVRTEFDRLGTMLFSFDSGTAPAIKQQRHMLLMANGGSLNFQVDEIGANLISNIDIMGLFLELFDGKVKPKIVKNTTESIRNEEIQGITPTNMMLFGVPQGLLDGGQVQDKFTNLLSMGYARRCFFGYVNDDVLTEELDLMSPEEKLAKSKSLAQDTTLVEAAKHLGKLANMINAHKRLLVPDETLLLFYEYENDCARRAHQMEPHDELGRSEMRQRFFKALKLAGAYAFIDESPEITVKHYEAAIKSAEESGEAFSRMQNRDATYVKLAKYMANVRDEVTQADLVADLSFYPKSHGPQKDLLALAIGWGYKNNIIIKKRYEDSIEFLRGESLNTTDLNKLRVSYSTDIAQGYNNEYAPWDQLHVLTQKTGLHWINHHVNGGHRQEDNCQPGFNMLVIDVDGGAPLSLAKTVLKDYKALFYTTKRHGENGLDRFRIILPMNYELKLDAKDYKEFMKNVFEWLPFDVDSQVGQRARKWLSHNGHYEYNEGELLDVLPFIPKTSRNEERKRKIQDQSDLDNLERWVMNTTGDGNRNNQLLRFAMILVDGGFEYTAIQRRVIDLNDKLSDKLEESEILGTIMVTVGKALAKQVA